LNSEVQIFAQSLSGDNLHNKLVVGFSNDEFEIGSRKGKRVPEEREFNFVEEVEVQRICSSRSGPLSQQHRKVANG
jgi:hypothetical protein